MRCSGRNASVPNRAEGDELMVLAAHLGSVRLSGAAVKRDTYFWRPDLGRPIQGATYDEYVANARPVLRIADLPRTKLVPDLPPVYLPRAMNGCVASEVAGALQIALKRDRQQPVSVPFIFYNARRLQFQESLDAGVSIYSALKACFYYGFCDQSVWPNSQVVEATDEPSQAAFAAALQTGVLNFYFLDKARWGTEFLRLCKLAISLNLPIVFGARVDDTFLDPDEYLGTANATVPTPEHPRELPHRHCLLAVGYDDNIGEFTVRDSVSPSRGIENSGYLRIKYDYVVDRELTSDFWVVPDVLTDAVDRWEELLKRRAEHVARAEQSQDLTFELYTKVKQRQIDETMEVLANQPQFNASLLPSTPRPGAQP
jgi:hypothetical protein